MWTAVLKPKITEKTLRKTQKKQPSESQNSSKYENTS